MMSVLLCNKVPFKDVILHNMVRDETGSKMSKSKGNVIDPMEIIEGCKLDQILSKITNSLLTEKEKKKSIKHKSDTFRNGIPKCGSDPLRFSLLSYVKENKEINMDIMLCIRDRNFCTKLWNSYKLIRMTLPENYDFPEIPKE